MSLENPGRCPSHPAFLSVLLPNSKRKASLRISNQPRIRRRAPVSAANRVAGSSFSAAYWPVTRRINQDCASVNPAPTRNTHTHNRGVQPNPAAQSLLTRLRGRAAPEAVLWPVTRSNKATAGSGTVFGGLRGAAELQPPPLERSVSVPGPCTPFGLWHQLCEPAAWSVSASSGLFPQTLHSPQDPGPRPRRPCFPSR